jgi:hypothetical protein
MHRKIAVKRLAASDLTLFAWHFRHRNAGGQKSITLNADVFIGEFYPALPELILETGGKIPVDLSLYGPGLKGLHNLQRKIIKWGSYKNWRLNGEFIHNPNEDEERYNVLEPGDLALMEFSGVALPDSVKAVLLAARVGADSSLHAALVRFMGSRRMAVLPLADLERITAESNTPEGHPALQMTLDLDLEDAALGGSQGLTRLFKRASLRQIGKDDLQHARRLADETGRIGEELVNSYLVERRSQGELVEVEWVSQDNAVAPFDFRVRTSGGELILIDAKTTSGEFERPIHVSLNELLQIANGAERYDIYRVYGASIAEGQLRTSPNLRGFGQEVLRALAALPEGVAADSVSVSPRRLQFTAEVTISLPDNDEPQG